MHIRASPSRACLKKQKVPRGHRDTSFSSVKAFFHFSSLPQSFQQAISIQDISPNYFLDLWHFLSPVTTFSSVYANFFFTFLLLKILFLIPGEMG